MKELGDRVALRKQDSDSTSVEDLTVAQQKSTIPTPKVNAPTVTVPVNSTKIPQLPAEVSTNSIAFVKRFNQLLLNIATNDQYSYIIQFPGLIQVQDDKKTIDTNVKNQNGSTALHVAANRGDFELFEMLLQCGADLHAKNFNNQSALDLLSGKTGSKETAGHRQIKALVEQMMSSSDGKTTTTTKSTTPSKK